MGKKETAGSRETVGTGGKCAREDLRAPDAKKDKDRHNKNTRRVERWLYVPGAGAERTTCPFNPFLFKRVPFFPFTSQRHGTHKRRPNNTYWKNPTEWSMNSRANINFFTDNLLDYKPDVRQLKIIKKISNCLNNGSVIVKFSRIFRWTLYGYMNKIEISRDDRKYFNNISKRAYRCIQNTRPSITLLLVNMSIILRLSCQITFKHRFHFKISDAIAVLPIPHE